MDSGLVYKRSGKFRFCQKSNFQKCKNSRNRWRSENSSTRFSRIFDNRSTESSPRSFQFRRKRSWRGCSSRRSKHQRSGDKQNRDREILFCGSNSKSVSPGSDQRRILSFSFRRTRFRGCSTQKPLSSSSKLYRC